MNTTGLKPAPGYILLECVDIRVGMITVPEKFKNTQERDESTQRVSVVEDASELKLPFNTRVLIESGKGINHRGRKLLLTKPEEIIAIYDETPQVSENACQLEIFPPYEQTR